MEHTDRQSVLEIMDLNTPAFFHPMEREDFVEYLEKKRQDYFVIEKDDQVVGCGGLNYFPQNGIVRISWDMIHPDYQYQGLGTKLLEYRLDFIQTKYKVNTIVVRTSQHAVGFYKAFGFVLEEISLDFWAPGYDLYGMTRDMT